VTETSHRLQGFDQFLERQILVIEGSQCGVANLAEQREKAAAVAAEVKAEVRSAGGTKTERAKQVGTLVGDRAKAAGVERVVFDRAGFKYHGRIRALAEGARESGLEF
jgi:ribosomal protein L18